MNNENYERRIINLMRMGHSLLEAQLNVREIANDDIDIAVNNIKLKIAKGELK